MFRAFPMVTGVVRRGLDSSKGHSAGHPIRVGSVLRSPDQSHAKPEAHLSGGSADQCLDSSADLVGHSGQVGEAGPQRGGLDDPARGGTRRRTRCPSGALPPPWTARGHGPRGTRPRRRWLPGTRTGGADTASRRGGPPWPCSRPGRSSRSSHGTWRLPRWRRRSDRPCGHQGRPGPRCRPRPTARPPAAARHRPSRTGPGCRSPVSRPRRGSPRRPARRDRTRLDSCRGPNSR